MRKGGILPDDFRKDVHVSVRMTRELRDKLRACALREGVSQPSLVANIVSDYVDKDIDVTRQMMASQSRLHSDVRRLGDVSTLCYNLLHSFIYTFFIAFGNDCSLEFATEEYTKDKDLLARGTVRRKNADRVMELFTRKFVGDESVRRGILANFADMQNHDVPEGKEEAV